MAATDLLSERFEVVVDVQRLDGDPVEPVKELDVLLRWDPTRLAAVGLPLEVGLVAPDIVGSEMASMRIAWTQDAAGRTILRMDLTDFGRIEDGGYGLGTSGRTSLLRLPMQRLDCEPAKVELIGVEAVEVADGLRSPRVGEIALPRAVDLGPSCVAP